MNIILTYSHTYDNAIHHPVKYVFPLQNFGVLATVLCTHGHLVETSINLNILMLFQNIRIYESFPKYF